MNPSAISTTPHRMGGEVTGKIHSAARIISRASLSQNWAYCQFETPIVLLLTTRPILNRIWLCLQELHEEGFRPNFHVILKVETMITTTTPGLAIKSQTLRLLTDKKLELYNITQKVKDFVKSTSIRDGLLLITSLHTTTALFINEVQSALLDDIKTILHDWVREEQSWKHNSPEYSDCERHNAGS